MPVGTPSVDHFERDIANIKSKVDGGNLKLDHKIITYVGNFWRDDSSLSEADRVKGDVRKTDT